MSDDDDDDGDDDNDLASNSNSDSKLSEHQRNLYMAVSILFQQQLLLINQLVIAIVLQWL